METGRNYLVAVALLAVLAVGFGVFGTVAPPLAEETGPAPQQDPPESVGHIQNPPTYDSGWLDIRDKLGQSFTLTHDLNTRDVFVDVTGRRKSTSAEHKLFFGSTNHIPGWSEAYGQSCVGSTSLAKTSDGGYAIACANDTYPSINQEDFWLVKTYASGIEQWNRTYGGANREWAYSVIQTIDGGYAIAGSNYSDITSKTYASLVKTFADGTMQWNKTYELYAGVAPHCVVQTTEGGYAIAGLAAGVPGTSFDFVLIKTDSTGEMSWSQVYGGTGIDEAYSVVQTSDGGYALAGYTNSFGAGSSDFWLVKTYPDGTLDWSKTYGRSYLERALSLVQTSDEGYALAGYKMPSDYLSEDFWLVKTDSQGNDQWNTTCGRTYRDEARSVVQTEDGGYALAGSSGSGGDDSDLWLVKMDLRGNVQWNTTCGKTDVDQCPVVQTDDGAYVVAGIFHTESSSFLELIRTNVTDGSSIGLSMVDFTDSTITLRRGETDPYWNFIRVRVWIIKEPSWIYGDINMDGVVDSEDLYILSRNYGRTFSLLSLGGIIGIAGIHTVRKRKQAS